MAKGGPVQIELFKIVRSFAIQLVLKNAKWQLRKPGS